MCHVHALAEVGRFFNFYCFMQTFQNIHSLLFYLYRRESTGLAVV